MKSVRISLIRNSEVEGHVAALDSKLFNGFYLGMVRPVGEAIRGSADHGRRNKVRA